MVVGIQVNPNNRAVTVFDLFLDATKEHGMPYHVRGDHGVENVLVADHMEATRGPGSYIWGRCAFCFWSFAFISNVSSTKGVSTIHESNACGLKSPMTSDPNGRNSFTSLKLSAD